MALIVENGTGVVDAESYVDDGYYQAWAAARGVTISSDQTVREQKLREATEYADSIVRYKGSRSSGAQGLEFPRDGLIDWSSLTITGVPKRLKDGVCYLASVAENESLFVDLDRGGAIKSESVGPISTTYMDGAPAYKQFTRFEKLVEQYVMCASDQRPSPGWSGPETDGATPMAPSIFNIGMNDFQPDADGDTD